MSIYLYSSLQLLQCFLKVSPYMIKQLYINWGHTERRNRIDSPIRLASGYVYFIIDMGCLRLLWVEHALCRCPLLYEKAG